MSLIFNIIYLFVALYTLYFFALSVRNLFSRPFRTNFLHSSYEDKENIAVVVYSHNNRKTLANLINDLKSQDYPINKFRVFVLLDNCTDGSQELFTEENFIHVIDISNQGTVGKDSAVSTLLEKIKDNDFVETYVFLDADRSVASNFLSIVSAAVKKDSVISGETVIEIDCLGVVDRIKAAYQKYHMNFMKSARSHFGLAAQADSGVLVIKTDVIRQIGEVDFKSVNTELKYSLLLSRISNRCTYNPNLQTIVHPANYVFRKPNLSYRLDLFKNCMSQLATRNLVFVEHVISLIYPNIWTLILLYAFLIYATFSYSFMANLTGVLLTFGVLVASFGLSLVNAKMTIKEIGYLCLYPAYSVCHIVRNFPPIRFMVNKIWEQAYERKHAEKFLVDVIVTVGRNNLKCCLEFISHEGMCKVRFIYKNKKYTTSTHLRMIDALEELKTKLDDYGYILRICSCCSHFKSLVDGSTNMLRGACDSEYPSPTLDENGRHTIVWNTCSAFTPAKPNNLIADMVKETEEKS